MIPQTITANKLGIGDRVHQVRAAPVAGKVIHGLDWLSPETAKVTGGRILVRLEDDTQLYLEPDVELSVEPYCDAQLCASSLTEYVVIFESVEPGKTSYGKPTGQLKETSVLAVDRKSASMLAQTKLGLIAFNDINDAAGWRIKKISRYDVDQPIVLECWMPNPDQTNHPGTIVVAGRRTIGEIYLDLEESLIANDLIDEYISGLANWRSHGGLTDKSPWPKDVRAVACYAVTGGSEGWYVHMGVILEGETTRVGADNLLVNGPAQEVSLFLAKTFKGWNHAWAIASKAAELLGA